MIRRPPRSTRTDTLFPYTTLVLSQLIQRQTALAAHVPQPGAHLSQLFRHPLSLPIPQTCLRRNHCARNAGRMEDEQWDVIVIGGGVSGLSAALMLGRARRRVLVIDAGRPRNRFAAHLHGVLGNAGTDPAELLRRGRREASAYGVQLHA